MKRLLLIMLCLCICASTLGCSWMNGNYSAVTPHAMDPEADAEDVIQVSNYSQLRNALSELVDSGATMGVFSMVDYSQVQISSDMGMAISYIQQSTPIGAYAVDRISYETGSGTSQNLVSIDISYVHGKSEIEQIKTVRGITGASSAIATTLRQYGESLVLQITDYNPTDFAQLVADYAAAHPDLVIEAPLVTAQIYPSTGEIRVVELLFQYQTSRDSLRSMQTSVRPIFSSAELYVSTEADPYTKYNQLYTFLMERFDYTFETSITPAYSLLLHGVGDSKAFAQVYAAMCHQVDLECLVVSGTYNGESRFWNIISDGEAYYHVDLLRSYALGGYSQYADEEMEGYVWDYSGYPVCGLQTTEEPTGDPEE